MGNRDQVPRCESESGMDHEQELGGKNDIVRVWNAGEWSVGAVQETAEEGVERASGEEGSDGRGGSEKKMDRENRSVEGDDLHTTRT